MNELKWDKVSFSLTDLALVGVLRFVSGFGLGLLLAESISKRSRKRLGWSLFMGSLAVGAPLGIRMLRGVDTLHLNARRVIGGDSRFARFPNGNHPRSACPALSNI